jgi:hypothetical protein
MNRQPILDSWTGGQLFGNTGQFALAPGHGPGPGGHRARHATDELADATDELSRRPGQLAGRPDGLAGLTDESAGRPGDPAEPPGELAGRPGRLSRRPSQSDGRPGEPEGGGEGARSPGAALRRGGGARREGIDGLRAGFDGPRERGFCARGGGDLALARAVFVPEGRRGVATGGASRSDAEPVGRTRAGGFCPGGAEESSPARDGRAGENGRFLRPCRGGFDTHDAPHGLRSLEDSLTPPVATALDPSGVERHGHVSRENGHARAIGARGRVGGVHAFAGEVPEAPPAACPSGISGAARALGVFFRSGEVPEGRPPHTPLWHQRTGGSEVRRGY